MSNTKTITPRVYVASLTDYNAGRLHGEWIDANQSVEAIVAEIAGMLAASPTAAAFPISGPAEEWAIHDYDGWGGLSLGEYTSLETVSTLGNLIVEHGEAFSVYADHVGLDYATADEFFEAYQGEHASETDYAFTLADDLGTFTEDARWPFTCIDWDHAWRELSYDGYYAERSANGGVHVFRSL